MQKVLDAGAMGMMFPHLNTLVCFGPMFSCNTIIRDFSNKDILQSDDAKNPTSTTKFPPRETFPQQRYPSLNLKEPAPKK